MNKKTLDLKGEEETPTDDGQSANTSDDISDDSIEDNSEEKVELSKEEYDKLLADKENYKKGLLSYKEKAKEQPKEEPKDVFTKTDFHKINEDKAINAFLKDNPEVDGKWSDFISFYNDKSGRDSVEDIINDLDDAKTLFLKHNPIKKEDDNQTKAKLTSEKSLESSSSDDVKPQKTGNKFLDARGEKITEWYK